MYELWYNYVKPKYGENAKLCYMDTESFIVHVKTFINIFTFIEDIYKNIYKDIGENVERRFDTSSFVIDRPLPKKRNKKVIGLMKGELAGEIMKEFVGLREKAYSYLKGNNDEDKKSQKCVS